MSEQKMREALEQARLALEPYDDVKPRDWISDRQRIKTAHALVVEALSQREAQEPVVKPIGYITQDCLNDLSSGRDVVLRHSVRNTPVYTTPPSREVPDEGKLWSFLRNVLSQGAAIHQDKHDHYERYSARLDAAAAERATELLALLASKGGAE